MHSMLFNKTKEFDFDFCMTSNVLSDLDFSLLFASFKLHIPTSIWTWTPKCSYLNAAEIILNVLLLF